jgi:hypothetical protein
MYKVSFKIGNRKYLSPKTFSTKASAKKTISRIPGLRVRSKYKAHYKRIKNPRLIKIQKTDDC